MWTHFMDMHSGGGQKLDWAHIYIEAPQEEAELIFFKRFGRNPNRVTCTCCGQDYSITGAESLAHVTGYERGCDFAYFDAAGNEVGDEDYWHSLPREQRAEANRRSGYVERPSKRAWGKPFITLEDYMKRDDVHFVPASHIKPEERAGKLKPEGYVWAGDE